MNDFYETLNRRFGIMPPAENEQDWEFTCGDASQTEEYISFYIENASAFCDEHKEALVNMMIQGFEDLYPGLDQVKRDKIWNGIKNILTEENGHHDGTIKYWASPDTSPEDAFYVSGYMRELMRKLNIEWNEVTTAADIEYLNNIYDYFEDSLIVSISYISGNTVDSDLVGDMRGDNDLRIVFQRLDKNPFSIELWFVHTKQMRFKFVNPSDHCQMDIMKAKVCRNSKSLFWTTWDEFDPDNEEHRADGEAVHVESESLKWRILE